VNGSRPSEARDRVLSRLPLEKQLDIMQRAEKRGPRPDDPDWLLVETIMDAKDAMQRGAMLAPEALTAIKAAIGEPPASGPDAATAARLDRIEALLRRLGKPAEADRGDRVFRDLVVFLIALMTATAAVVFGVGLPSPITTVAAFALGVTGAMAYVHLAPVVTRRQ
jgi:hypothetical protein